MNKFIYRGKPYDFFYHPGNQTAVNERCMELPIAFDFAEKYKDIIEIGNVTRHYHREYTHDVVDLFEKSAWPIFNEDILTWTPKKEYKAALSVSTVEHTVDTKKAIENIIKLTPHYLITVPFGYETTKDILDWDFPMYFMRRVSEDNDWEQTNKKQIRGAKYNYPFRFANAVAIITNE